MKLLIVTPVFPYPLDAGGKQGQYHFINNLRSQIEITLLVPLEEEQIRDLAVLKSLWPDVTIVTFTQGKKRRSITDKIKSKLKKTISRPTTEDLQENNDVVRYKSSLFYSAFKKFPTEFSQKMRELLKEKHFDFIQVEFYEYLSLVNKLPANVKRIFVHHEIRYVRNQREISLFKTVDRADNELFELYKKNELEALGSYDTIITVSENDKQELEKYLPGKTIVASPSTILNTNNSKNKTYKFNNKLVFVGSSVHFPNLDGIIWFLKNIWPGTLKSNPELSFHVVGNWDEEEIVSYTGPLEKVVFEGFVGDLGFVLENAIMVIPLRIGSGMRMKIIDAINSEIPFISTAIGVEGLEFMNGKDCLIADGSDLKVAITKIVNDAALQNSLIKNSISTLNKKYNFENLIRKRRDIYFMKND